MKRLLSFRSYRLNIIYVGLTLFVFLIVNLEDRILPSLFYWSTLGVFLGRGDLLLPLTYSMAWLTEFILCFLLIKRSRVNPFVAIFYGFTASLLWIAIFEIIWQNSFLLFGDNLTLINEIWMLSWILLGTVSWKYWTFRNNKILWYQITAYAFLWITWIVIGYPQMPSFSGYLLNVVLKILSCTLILSLFLPKKIDEEKRGTDQAILNSGLLQ